MDTAFRLNGCFVLHARNHNQQYTHKLNIQQHSIYKITTVNIHKQISFPHRDSRLPAVRRESQVCYHSATKSPQFDVSFPEKLRKIVATRGEIFSLKFTVLYEVLNIIT